MSQWDFLKPLQYVWNCNGNIGQGFPIIIQFTTQINYLCERWRWQFVPLCTSFYFNCWLWYTFGTCSSLTRVVCLANKACQYACNDTKVFVGLKEVNLKATQSRLQKTITWIEKFNKECNKFGIGHALIIGFPIENWKDWWKLGLLAK
jgi:hypothetical protein